MGTVKVLILSGGSPNGKTYRMCQSFISALPEGWDASLVQISDEIAHCTGCNRCRTGDCVFHDDMDDIVRKMDASDAVIFATPIRFNGPSSMMKAVIDRFQAVWNRPDRLSPRRRIFTFMATAGSNEPNLAPCTTIFRSFCMAFGGDGTLRGIWYGSERHRSDGTGDGICGSVLEGGQRDHLGREMNGVDNHHPAESQSSHAVGDPVDSIPGGYLAFIVREHDGEHVF